MRRSREVGPHLPSARYLETPVEIGLRSAHSSRADKRKYCRSALKAWTGWPLPLLVAWRLHSCREAYKLLRLLSIETVEPVLDSMYKDAQAWEQLSLRLGCSPVGAKVDQVSPVS